MMLLHYVMMILCHYTVIFHCTVQERIQKFYRTEKGLTFFLRKDILCWYMRYWRLCTYIKKHITFHCFALLLFLFVKIQSEGATPPAVIFLTRGDFRLVTLLSFLLSRAHRNGLYHWSGKSIHWYVMFWTFYWIFVVTQWHAHFHKILEKRPRGFFCTFKSTLKFVHTLLPGVI